MCVSVCGGVSYTNSPIDLWKNRYRVCVGGKGDHRYRMCVPCVHVCVVGGVGGVGVRGGRKYHVGG